MGSSPARRTPPTAVLIATAVLTVATFGAGVYGAFAIDTGRSSGDPQATVRAFYDALKAGDCAAAEALVSSSFPPLCDEPATAAEGAGALQSILSVTQDGGRAEALIERTVDGLSDQRYVLLRAQEGAWLIDGVAPCRPAQQPEDLGNAHLGPDDELDVSDYSSNPPTSGPHSHDTAETGVYDRTPPLGKLLHSMEHGTVILWMNGLSEELVAEVRAATQAQFSTGYDALAVTPYEDMEHRLVMTAWGHYQSCVGVDAEAVGAFVEQFYASGPEGFIACFATAKNLPPCRDQSDQ